MKISILSTSNKTGAESLSTCDFHAFLTLLTDVTKAQYIQQLRKEYYTLSGDINLYPFLKKIKKVCFSSLLMKKRTGEVLQRTYNGLLVINVSDLKTQVEVEMAKKEAGLLPQTLAAFAGMDGHSVNIITHAVLPSQNLPTTEKTIAQFHVQAYRIAVQCYAPTLSFPIELQEPDVFQTIWMSFDPAPFVNELSIPFVVEQPKGDEIIYLTKTDADKRTFQTTVPSPQDVVGLTRLFNACCHKVMPDLQAANLVGDQEACVISVARQCAKVGFPEEDAAYRLHQRYPNLDVMDINSLVRSIYAEQEVPSQLHVDEVINKKQLAAFQLREFLNRRYEIRYNILSGCTEFRERRSFSFLFREMTRRDHNTIRHQSALEGIEAFDSEISGLMQSEFIPHYNPIEDYLSNVGTWDGNDYIRQLADLVPTDNPNWTRLFHRWFLSMVAHWMGYDDEHANSTAPILVGEQGFRKSTFCRILLPPELRQYFTDSIDFRNNVEAERYLSRFLLINIDEFDQLTDKQFAFIKHLFQKPVVNLRRSYSNVIERQTRYASFIGTTNQQEVLRDPTGNRRFFCVQVTYPILVDTPINYHQLYAQAIALIQQGERFWLNDDDEKLIRQANGDFDYQTPLEQILRDFFERALPSEPDALWLTSSAIAKELHQHPEYKAGSDNLIQIGRLLTQKLGVTIKHTRDGNLFLVKRK